MGYDHFYLDDNQNRREMQRAVVSNYTPAIKLIERLVETRGSKFAISISISGAVLEQLREYSPLMIDQLCHLAQFRQIEWIAETHHHTLSSLFDYKEFQTQVDNYRQLLDEILSDWAQNELQREAINQIYNLRDRVKSLNNVNLTNAWRLLQSVDNFRPMSFGSDR